MHEREDVPDGVGLHDLVARDGADAAVGQRGRHHRHALRRDLHRAALGGRRGSEGVTPEGQAQEMLVEVRGETLPPEEGAARARDREKKRYSGKSQNGKAE